MSPRGGGHLVNRDASPGRKEDSLEQGAAPPGKVKVAFHVPHTAIFREGR